MRRSSGRPPRKHIRSCPTSSCKGCHLAAIGLARPSLRDDARPAAAPLRRLLCIAQYRKPARSVVPCRCNGERGHHSRHKRASATVAAALASERAARYRASDAVNASAHAPAPPRQPQALVPGTPGVATADDRCFGNQCAITATPIASDRTSIAAASIVIIACLKYLWNAAALVSYFVGGRSRERLMLAIAYVCLLCSKPAALATSRINGWAISRGGARHAQFASGACHARYYHPFSRPWQRYHPHHTT